MKTWDLTSGAAKLGLALQSLQAASAQVEEYWDDAAYRKFREAYISPVEPNVRNVLDTLHRLSEVLVAADRQCGINT
jgi:hypothetical protein